VRLSVKAGPIYVGTSTRRRSQNGGCGSFIAVIFFLGAVAFWPLALGQEPNGGYHPWVWAIAIPWWMLLTFALIVLAGSKSRKK
jgi:sterol desaturase/sphingolipid hydroxylase (fatty acid hydroxylase superfamily)